MGSRRQIGIIVAIMALSLVWVAWPKSSASAGDLVGAAGTAGNLVVPTSGTWRELSVTDRASGIDVRFNVRSDKRATGWGQTVSVIARGSASEYRARVRFENDGRVSLAIIRDANGSRRLVASLRSVPNLVHQPGQSMALRVRLSGSQSTSVAIKAWPVGRSQPRTWSLVSVDNGARLGTTGWLALRFGVSSTTTNPPVTYSYDGVLVSDATTDPTPTPTPPPSASPFPTATSPQPTAQPTPEPTTWPTPQPTGAVTTPSPTPSSTPSATPSPTAAPPTPTPVPTPTASSTPSPTLPPVSGNAFYVAPNGNDAGNGSAAAPWRTLQKAADSVAAGATVLVREGTYAGFTMRRSGTAAEPITFSGYPGEHPVVDGRDAVAYTIRLIGVGHVRLVGLTVQGGFAERHSGGGISIESSSNVVVRDSLIRNNKAFGVRSAGSTNVLIDDNDITGNAVGVHINGAGEGTVVSDNLIHDNTRMMVNTADVPNDDVGAEGVALVRSTGRVVVRNNYLWGNRALSYDYGYDGGAFSVYAASNWTITGNTSWDNRNVLETGTDSAMTPCANNVFTRNLSYGATTEDRTVGMVLRCAENMLVANNTFRGIQHFVFALSHNRAGWGGSSEGLRIVNNVVSISTGTVYRIENSMPASVVINNNLTEVTSGAYVASAPGRGSTNSLATLRTWTGWELNGLQADPRFVDASANDYRLRSDSPAVDSATAVPGVTTGFTGSAPDMGYLER